MNPAPPQLVLVLAEEGHLQAWIAGVGFELLTGWRVAEGCCEFPGAMEYSLDALRRADAGVRRWWQPQLFVLPDLAEVAGLGGFKGPPRDGVVEIGYSVAPAWRGKGLATTAVRAMCANVFAEPGIVCVAADTLPERNASVRVLEKAGFAHVGDGTDEDVGRTWRWERRRA